MQMTPITVVIRIAIIIFLSEGLIMLGLSLAEPIASHNIEALVDAAVLTLLSSPLTYFWVIRPYINARNLAEEALLKARDELEIRVRERTRDLTQEIAQRKKMEVRLETEVNAARHMQTALLPPPALIEKVEKEYGLQIQSHFETSSELGGDLWGIHSRMLKDHHVGIFIADFTGHGVSAAVNTFRLHAMMHDHRPSDGDPAAYLAVLNEHLQHLLPTVQFATMFYGIFNSQSHTLTYSAAASPSPVIGRIGSPEMELQDASGIPLGIKQGAEYQNREVKFPPGSFLFLYSDALVETVCADGTLLTEEDAMDLLRQGLSDDCPQPPLEYLVGAFHEKAGGPLDDDLTAVLVRHHP